MRYFIQIVTGGTDPEIHAEYKTEEEREQAMKALHMDGEVSDEDSAFYLDVSEDGTPKLYTVSGIVFDAWVRERFNYED